MTRSRRSSGEEPFTNLHVGVAAGIERDAAWARALIQHDSVPADVKLAVEKFLSTMPLGVPNRSVKALDIVSSSREPLFNLARSEKHRAWFMRTRLGREQWQADARAKKDASSSGADDTSSQSASARGAPDTE